MGCAAGRPVSWTTAAFTALVLAGPLRAATPEVKPLDAEHREAFKSSPQDPHPKVLDGVSPDRHGKHYLAGNEWSLHLFYDKLKGLGGGYVGVGAEQAYLFIGWQRPEVAWLIDYDQLVVDIHAVYQAIFLAAGSPDEFMDLWARGSRAKAKQIIAEAYRDKPRLMRHLLAHRVKYRGVVNLRLIKLREKLLATKVPTFLTEQETYSFVRELIRAGRVRALRVDLLAYRGMRGIGQVARKLGVPIRVVYASNAEQYWDYQRRFRLNIEGLPTDSKSLWLRTMLTWARNRDYRYVIQPMDNFRAWLAKPWVVGVRQLVPNRQDDGKEPDFVWCERDVEEVERRRREQRKRKEDLKQAKENKAKK